MPRGSECDPEHAWWQGTVLLEVEVPAFRDSDGDGLGDLPGVLSSLDHIQVKWEWSTEQKHCVDNGNVLYVVAQGLTDNRV